jgi:CubicO group peptidase (beta-lactamase class C family)
MKVAVIQERPAGSGAAASAATQEAPRFYTVPASREITVQDLLTHLSGLVSGGAASRVEAAKVARKPGETLADYIPRLGMTPLDFQPGSRWSYSPSAGFDTLGRIVEIISGQTFDQFLRQRIFEPLGMKDTFFHPPEDRLARVATTYHRAGDTLQKWTLRSG